MVNDFGINSSYSKTCVKLPLSKRPKIGFQAQLSLNAGQKYCRMLHREHSAILSTFITLSFVIKIFVLSIFEWLPKTGFTVHATSPPPTNKKNNILISGHEILVKGQGSDEAIASVQPCQSLCCSHIR